MSADLAAALDQIADNTQARAAYRQAYVDIDGDDTGDGETAPAAAALAALVVAAHARHHDGAARWCSTEACRAADAITHREAYP